MHAARRHARRSTAAVAAALLTAPLATGLIGASPAFAEPPPPAVRLEPAKLTRGADIAVPHVEGDDLVVGDRRVDLPGARVRLLGASDDAHVVTTSRLDGSRARVLRVEADGSLTTLLTKASSLGVQLSEDGSRLVTLGYGTRRSSAISVRSATTGELLVTRSFRGYPSVLTARRGKVLITTEQRGVVLWSTGSGRLRAVTERYAGRASITHDLLATYTKDPYQGGCTRLTRLSDPRETLWRSCTERVDTFSPDGARMATVDILSDGIGPGAVVQREIDGTILSAYTSTGWFGLFSWESPTTMLLETHGKQQTAVVRCRLDECENVTDPVETVEPRPAA